MLRTMCKGKIHRARVTEARLDYTGSITIDEKLMLASDIRPYVSETFKPPVSRYGVSQRLIEERKPKRNGR